MLDDKSPTPQQTAPWDAWTSADWHENNESPYIIAYIGPNDCDENHGFLALYDPDTGIAELFQFSHCSCYDTWSVAATFWRGDLPTLIHHARRRSDPSMMERTITHDDTDETTTQALALYCEIMEWLQNQPQSLTQSLWEGKLR